ncbi:MAG: hypothetical protein IT353_12225, partial [Gemmatimonadaceae bacterium]|nr:hypothetical protein [Gemmatimonadaceae bacterium]
MRQREIEASGDQGAPSGRDWHKGGWRAMGRLVLPFVLAACASGGR